jgi:hypothetical protein
MTDTARNDDTLEQELTFNERIIEHPKIGHLKLIRPTPRIERLISEERRKQHHKDLRNPDVLSRKEVERYVIERGVWSEEESNRISDLWKRIGQIMTVLDITGFTDLESLASEYREVVDAIYEAYAEDSPARAAVRRFFDVVADRRETADRVVLKQESPGTEQDDRLEQAEELYAQILLAKELNDIRVELDRLQERSTELFLECVENRADRAEETARLYYCVRKVDEDAPFWPSIDAVLDSPREVMSYIQQEMYFFRHGITSEFQSLLGRHGFTQRVNDTVDSSDDSPGHPQSNSDGESPASEPISSSEVTE